MVDIEENWMVIDEIYEILVSEFITIQGFYFASSIRQTYKKISSKSLQNTIGVRKTLLT